LYNVFVRVSLRSIRFAIEFVYVVPKSVPNYVQFTLTVLFLETRNLTRKGIHWATKGGMIAKAKIEIGKDMNLSALSSKEKRKATLSNAEMMANALMKAIQAGGLYEVFSQAGERYRVLATSEGLNARLMSKYDEYLANPWNTELLAELESLEEQMEEAHDYTTMKGDPEQVEYLKALDFVDALTPDLRCFNVCRAKLGSGETCGHAFPSKLWLQPDKARWKFKCQVDWQELINAHMAHPGDEMLMMWVRQLKTKFGDDLAGWPKIGCGAKFVPWGKGPSIVLELKLEDGSFEAFAADRIPTILDDEIKKAKAHFYMAAKTLTPQQLKDVIPMQFPITHVVDQATFPGALGFIAGGLRIVLVCPQARWRWPKSV
jgi:hypothetical protein